MQHLKLRITTVVAVSLLCQSIVSAQTTRGLRVGQAYQHLAPWSVFQKPQHKETDWQEHLRDVLKRLSKGVSIKDPKEHIFHIVSKVSDGDVQDRLGRLLAVASRYGPKTIEDCGINVLAKALTQQEVGEYSRLWTFGHKEEEFQIRSDQWLFVESEAANFVRMGKYGQDGENHTSLYAGRDDYVTAISGLEPNNRYWLTFYWKESGHWEGRDYYITVLPPTLPVP